MTDIQQPLLKKNSKDVDLNIHTDSETCKIIRKKLENRPLRSAKYIFSDEYLSAPHSTISKIIMPYNPKTGNYTLNNFNEKDFQYKIKIEDINEVNMSLYTPLLLDMENLLKKFRVYCALIFLLF